MEFGMSAQGFTKELRGAANGRILGHAAGFLGANLVFGSLYLWGFPFFMWVLHGGWAATAAAEFVLDAPSALLAQLTGWDALAAKLLLDAVLAVLTFLGGLAFLAFGARQIGTRLGS